jgi:hypothetical protein
VKEKKKFATIYHLLSKGEEWPLTLIFFSSLESCNYDQEQPKSINAKGAKRDQI